MEKYLNFLYHIINKIIFLYQFNINYFIFMIKINLKVNSEKKRSQKLAEENERSKSRLAKKSVNPKDHDAQSKIDIARISGKDRTTGDAKAHLDNQILKTEAARDSIKKSLNH